MPLNEYRVEEVFLVVLFPRELHLAPGFLKKYTMLRHCEGERRVRTTIMQKGSGTSMTCKNIYT